MKLFSKRTALLTTTAVAVLSLGAVAFADSIMTPAQIYSEVTGKTVEQAYTDRQTSGESYGKLAQDAGKYEEFKSQMMESKKAVLEERVSSGQMTQEQADALMERMENCEGDSQGLGRAAGAGFGRGSMQGKGNGERLKDGSGQGLRNGSGFGQGNGNGQGINQAK
ncbi:hypothetical protein EAL2_c21100 [Peptoclostridium acidaminophilum DSM 3953]|uniref:DUF1104 domain-containing protein n=1 Tax=Peptoclostridium acidaminophilum DSM 3953 TaxID=1286171 RepID=W8U958_PEPAC|nr:DUF2680 domain-containing protein [Peptoclostridium acidaminophilum]AHM57391.1 hypothetical protein EAL2_c21100 [Peptoclostridium acidaminophilum DSM 3953]